MTLYYTHKYREIGLSSHKLLEHVIADYLNDRKQAKGLVASMKRDNSRGYEGKPYIDGFEKFSISHSGGSWAVLIDSRECGLDIQYERSCNYLMIAARFFNPEDANVLAEIYHSGGDAVSDTRREFFRMWVKREALIKAIGLSVAEDGLSPVGIRNSAEYDGKRYYFTNIAMPEALNLHAAICLDIGDGIDDRLVYKEIYVRE